MDSNNEKIEQEFEKIEKTITEAPTPIIYHELEAVLNKWLLIKDQGMLKVIIATVVAHLLNADPVWLFIVAPPGGSKTEIIRGLNKIDFIYPLSELTPQTFLSGEKGRNASLLTRLKPNTLLTLKDFTTVLSMHRDNRHAILSQLREIYDGYYSKAFGTGETKTWEGKMGFIAGVTSIIDLQQAVFQVLGERFIQYRPEQPDKVTLAKRAIKNGGHEKLMREEIQTAFAGFINGLKIPDTIPPLPEYYEEKIANLATLITLARSGVIREGVSRDIDLVPDAELPTRLAKQLITLMSAFILVDNTAAEDNYKLIFKLAFDCLQQKRKRTVEALYGSADKVETSELGRAIGYPTNTARKVLEDLHALGLVGKENLGQGHPDRWFLTDYAKDLWTRSLPDGVSQTNTPEQTTLPDVSADALEKIDEVFGLAEEQALPDVSDDTVAQAGPS